jgi:hypothetical protein
MRQFFYGLLGGSVGGVATGLVFTYAIASLVGLHAPAGQVTVGAIAGGLVGALIAAVIAGDPDAYADSTAAQGIWGFVFGVIGGALGSSRFEIIEWISRYLR